MDANRPPEYTGMLHGIDLCMAFTWPRNIFLLPINSSNGCALS